MIGSTLKSHRGTTCRMLEIMNPDGTLNELGGCRLCRKGTFFLPGKLIAAQLREDGNLIAEEKHQNNVGFSERADVPD